ncbi:hypothetical protein BROUX41_006630 [Berkeleyomyces rouxiae]|uniref:uncharacterized protein n=1 Tax=Berkeleyomyces rouxiae TaxID=2035830 RepID=UPI003B77D524
MDDNDGIFNMALFDDEEEEQKTKDREARTALSEEAFQALRSKYEPKLENGKLHMEIERMLPLPAIVGKPETSAVVQAVEELYFYRRFVQAAALAESIVAGRGGLDEATAALLESYAERSRRRAANRVDAEPVRGEPER